MSRSVGALRGITVDVSDLDRGEAFWGSLLAVATRRRRKDYLWFEEIAPGVQLILQQVPERKVGKNRVHLDLGSPEPETLISTVEALGGSRVATVENDDYSLTVLADPDGNEFCILDRLSAGLADAMMGMEGGEE